MWRSRPSSSEARLPRRASVVGWLAPMVVFFGTDIAALVFVVREVSALITTTSDLSRRETAVGKGPTFHVWLPATLRGEAAEAA